MRSAFSLARLALWSIPSVGRTEVVVVGIGAALRASALAFFFASFFNLFPLLSSAIEVLTRAVWILPTNASRRIALAEALFERGRAWCDIEDLQSAHEHLTIIALLPGGSSHDYYNTCPSDFVMRDEAPLLINRFTDVEMKYYTVPLDSEQINKSTYLRAYKKGALRRAAAALSTSTIIGLSCTSFSFSVGIENVRNEFVKGSGGRLQKTTDMATAQIEGIRAVGGKRLALLTPSIHPFSGFLFFIFS